MSSGPGRTRSSADAPRRAGGAGPLLVLAACLIALLGALWPPSFHLTDHVIFWNVGRLYATGGSPYDPAVWPAALATYDNVNVRLIIGLGGALWPYPPWTGYLFVPFGLVPLEAGLWALHLSYLAVGVAAGLAIVRALPWRDRRGETIALLLVPTFQPFVYAERLGHFDSFLLAGVALATAGVLRRSPLALVAGALLLFTKPQVVPLFALAVTTLLVRDRRWRDIALASGALATFAAATTVLHPEGVAVAVGGGISRLSLIAPDSINPVPNVWALALAVAGAGGPVLAVALLLSASWACVAAVRWSPIPLRDRTILAASLILSVAVTPYVFSYDHLVLVPAAALVVAAADALPAPLRGARLALAVTVVTVLPWLLYFAGVAGGDHVLSALVPLSFAGLLALSMAALRSRPDPAAAFAA